MLRIDDLGLKELKIKQDTNLFSFGMDAVLLSDFVHCKKNARVLDIGTGNAILPLLLYGKNKSKCITGVELQKVSSDLALENIRLNKLEKYIDIINMDIKCFKSKELFDVVVSNPPYMQNASGATSSLKEVAIARTEICCNLGDIFKAARALLKMNASMFIVHRPNRLVDIFYEARSYGLEPKKIRFVKPYIHEAANLVLIEFRRGGGSFLTIDKDIIVYKSAGIYTDEIYKIYGMKR